ARGVPRGHYDDAGHRVALQRVPSELLLELRQPRTEAAPAPVLPRVAIEKGRASCPALSHASLGSRFPTSPIDTEPALCLSLVVGQSRSRVGRRLLRRRGLGESQTPRRAGT